MATSVSIKLAKSEIERLEALARSRKRSTQWLLYAAIDQYLEREEKREEYRLEALASLQEYRAMGRHLTEEEVQLCLGTWGDDRAEGFPDCHE